MYTTLFNLAMVATLPWVPLIFLPSWRWTRRLADTPAIPLFLSSLYVIGLVGLGVTYGPGVALNVFTAEGVTTLLANGNIGLVCWIHFLAFDLLVGLEIYRDNMARRYVPLWAQSVLLFFTMMFGPLGYVLYALIRWRCRKRQLGAAENTPRPAGEAPAPQAHAGHVTLRAVWSLFAARFRQDFALFCGSLTGLVLALVGLAVVLTHGRLIPPAGDLTKAIAFNTATGVYSLTLALLLPVAGFSPRGRHRWVLWVFGVGMTGYAISNFQVYRGIPARFSPHALAVDQLFGAAFNAVGFGLFVLFLIFAWRVLKRSLVSADGLLVLGTRYACASTLLAYLTGFWMFALGGPNVGPAGNLLPLHAIGFHGLQAVPLVALLLHRSAVPRDVARGWIHATGLTWLALAGAVAWITALGHSVLELSPGTLLAGALFALWVTLAGLAGLAWCRAGLRLLQAAAP
jgi:hypothetical protein